MNIALQNTNSASVVAPAYLRKRAGAQSTHPHFSNIAKSVCCRDWVPAFAGTTGLGAPQ